MSGTLNKVVLIGSLGRDPELKYTPSGKALAKFSLATNETHKNQAGEKTETTEWHNIIVWDKLAEICGQYLTKGQKIYLEGRIQSRSYEKDGQKRISYEIVGSNMIMLSSKKEGSSTGDKQSPATVGKAANAPIPEVSEDDIPF